MGDGNDDLDEGVLQKVNALMADRISELNDENASLKIEVGRLRAGGLTVIDYTKFTDSDRCHTCGYSVRREAFRRAAERAANPGSQPMWTGHDMPGSL